MQCSNCNAPMDKDAVFCGHCGKQISTNEVHEASVAYAARGTRHETMWPGSEGEAGKQPVATRQFIPPFQNPSPRTPIPVSQKHIPAFSSFIRFPGRPLLVDSSSIPTTSNAKSKAFLLIILVLLVVGVSAGFLTLLQNKHLADKNANSAIGVGTFNAKGTIAFSDGTGNTDSLKITINDLGDPPAGAHYSAWIINEQTEQVAPLGQLKVLNQHQRTYTLNFSAKGTNLLGLGSKLEITQEVGNATLPAGRVLLYAKFPDLALLHIKHLLLGFPTTPNTTGLLVGLRDQARLTHEQALHLQNAAGHRDINLCVAQNLINLIEGKHGAQAHPLSDTCTALNIAVSGDGFGLLGQNNDGYVSLAASHASLAATQPDATDTIRLHAHHVISATDNLKGWLTTLDSDAHALLANPNNLTKIPEMLSLSDHILNGIDPIGTGHGDHLAGATAAYAEGQLMASLTLKLWI